MDAEVTVGSVARTLRPGGTLAIWLYGRAIVVNNARVQNILSMVLDCAMEHLRPFTGPLQRSAQTLKSEGDNVAIDSDLFESGVRRIKWNCDQPFFYTDRDEVPAWVNRVGNDDFVERRTDPSLWEVWADRVWLEKYVDHLMPGLAVRDELRRLYDDLEEAIGGPGATVKLTWPVVLLLATRK